MIKYHKGLQRLIGADEELTKYIKQYQSQKAITQGVQGMKAIKSD